MRTAWLIATTSLAVSLMAVPAARGDVKNVWLGLQGAT
jgi:hypothetical protein